MDYLVKLNNQTSGRDKSARLCQYSSRVCWHILQERDLSRSSVDLFKSLEFTFSSFRKLLRFGRCLDTLYGSLSVLHYPDLTVRITITLSKISSALFLLADHMICISRIGITQINSEKWNRVANKYWLYSIIMNLIRDLYEITRILNRHKKSILPHTGQITAKNVLPIVIHSFKCIQSNKDIFVDTIKNGCDFWIPLAALGFIKVSPGTVGVLGVISSVAGLIALIDPFAKLTPV